MMNDTTTTEPRSSHPLPLALRPKMRREMFQWDYRPSPAVINGVKALYLGAYEGASPEQSENFFTDVMWDWLDDTIDEAEAVMDEMILRGFAWEVVWPETGNASTFGLTCDGEIWAEENLGAPPDFDPEDNAEEDLEFVTGLDLVRKGEGPPLPLKAGHQSPSPRITEWVAQATYNSEEAEAAIARVELALEQGLISRTQAGQFKRRIRERTDDRG